MVGNQTFDGSLKGSLAALGSALGFAAFTVTLRWGKETEMLPSVFLSGIFGVVITAMICAGLGLPLRDLSARLRYFHWNGCFSGRERAWCFTRWALNRFPLSS